MQWQWLKAILSSSWKLCSYFWLSNAKVRNPIIPHMKLLSMYNTAIYWCCFQLFLYLILCKFYLCVVVYIVGMLMCLYFYNLGLNFSWDNNIITLFSLSLPSFQTFLCTSPPPSIVFKLHGLFLFNCWCWCWWCMFIHKSMNAACSICIMLLVCFPGWPFSIGRSFVCSSLGKTISPPL